jgi:hypothetical protein
MQERDSGVFVPRTERPVHTDRLITEAPFPIEIDLAALIED